MHGLLYLLDRVRLRYRTTAEQAARALRDVTPVREAQRRTVRPGKIRRTVENACFAGTFCQKYSKSVG